MKLVLFLVLVSATLLLALPHKRAVDDVDVAQEVEENIDDGEVHDRQKRYYYYYSSPASSIANVVVVKPEKPTTIIDHKAEGGTGKAGGCTSEYPATSTMCIEQDSEDVVEYGFSPEDMQYIVDFHNEKRAEVDATDMLKIHWDDKLAVVAQKLSQACSKGHDDNSARKVPGYTFSVGQNYCGGLTLPNCLEKWYGEHKSFTYDDEAANKATGKIYGHYSQMMNKNSAGIGCGFANCFGSGGPLIHCNYAIQQTKKTTNKPWTAGEKGSACGAALLSPEKLCDVGLRYCMNYGKVNLVTGKCTCKQPYKGADCTTPDCSRSDKPDCGTGDYIAENCHKYINLPGRCRNMCGVCPAAAP